MCGQRNFLDREIFEGRLTLTQLGLQASVKADTPPTALGSVVHWYTQAALRAEFKSADGDMAFTGFVEADAVAQRPDQAKWDLARKLFSTDKAMMDAVHYASGLIANRLPKGKEWMAECAGNMPGLLTGHIDLLSSDHEHLVDIKTTGQIPEGGQMKPDHMWQLVAYALLVTHHVGRPPRFGSIIYVDRHGDWVCRSKPLDFHGTHQHLLTELFKWLELTRDYMFAPTPVFGDHCDRSWCPYRQICRDAFVPGGAAIIRRHEPVAVSANPFGGPNAV